MEKRDKITRICIWSVISALSILSGLFLFIWLMRVYIGNIENTPIYTRENVGAALLQIIAVLILFVVAVIVGGVLSYFKKLDDTGKTITPTKMKLEAILNHINCNDENVDTKGLLYEKNKRRIMWTIAFILELVAALFIFLYLIDNRHFPLDGNPTEMIKDLAFYTLPFLFVIAIIHTIGIFLEEASYKKSIEYAKSLLKEHRSDDKKDTRNYTKILWGIRGAIVLLAITLLIIGLAAGGADFVLRNAITICSACIGLG